MPVRNEAWVLGLSARVALMWCDELVILNHASTDASVDIIADFQREEPGRVHLISVPEHQWNEMDHRQMMLERARERRATHIAIVDADEILTANLLSCVRCDADRRMLLELPGYNLRGSLGQYHANGVWGERWFSVSFADDYRLNWCAREGYQHHHREPMGAALARHRPVAQHAGGVLHLWGASERRLRAKHALYKVNERLRWPQKAIQEIDRMYSWAFTGIYPGEPDNWSFRDVPCEWWESYARLMRYLDVDDIPWQEAEVRRLMARHGAALFARLNLFGIA